MNEPGAPSANTAGAGGAPLIVDRCVCAGTTFERLVRASRAANPPLTLERLSAATGCCVGCGLCEVYVRRALATGETAFALLPAKTRTNTPPDAS